MEIYPKTLRHTLLFRTGEVEGVDYYFTERSVMEKMIYSGQMLEFGEFRGTV